MPVFVWITFKRPNFNNLDTNLDTKNDNLDTNLDDLDTNLDTNNDNSDTKFIAIEELSDKQKEVLRFCNEGKSSREILEHIGVINHTKNRYRFILSLVDAGLLERTIPESPYSPNQKYIVKKDN
ncbi:MAG: hypothetical protein IK025_04105 [Bacteroidales bacterium]|nr:hypothetical protein [Bacteroidales bacterium]